MDHSLLYTILALSLGLFMTWGVGANDLANVMSTAMGSKAISLRTAIIIAIIFEFAGAFFGGAGVSNTVRNGIIDLHALSQAHDFLLNGMLAILAAGTVWINLASYFGLPVSITNSIVGGIVGFATLVLGVEAIHWEHVSYIAISWICSPLFAAIFAYILMISIHRIIFAPTDPVAATQKYIAYYFFLVGYVLSLMIIIKGFRHFGLFTTTLNNVIISAAFGVFVTLIGRIAIQKIPLEHNASRHKRFQYIEKIFSILMGFTACAMIFAHGSNDVSIAVGPMAVVIKLAAENSQLSASPLPLPQWITFLGCTGVVLGLFMYGRKVIATVGSSITSLTPSRAFAATLAAATTVLISTSFGIPVSATQTLVGGVLGVGLARGIAALNLRVIRNIFTSWIITIPATSVLAIMFYGLFKKIL